MSDLNYTESAFPRKLPNKLVPSSKGHYFIEQEDFSCGITIEDYFAAAYLTGLASIGTREQFKIIAELAYAQANEMLIARKKV